MLRDPDRRVLLARFLQIPPALLGLDWRLVVHEDNLGTHANPPAYAQETSLEDSFYHNEDTLAMAWDAIYTGRSAEFAERFERRLLKLIRLVDSISGPDKEAWLGLLCQYYQVAVGYAQHRGSGPAYHQLALDRCNLALQIARETDDTELLASSYYMLADIYRSSGDYVSARDAAAQSMRSIEYVGNPAQGNILMISADMASRLSIRDPQATLELRNWQDKALTIAYKGDLEPDRTFIRFNRAAIHHERAKTLLRGFEADPTQSQLVKETQSELRLAWEGLTPDVSEWQMYFLETEARLHLVLRDLEASAKQGIASLKAARNHTSLKGERQVRVLYSDLQKLDASNPYVCNLGMQLGLF